MGEDTRKKAQDPPAEGDPSQSGSGTTPPTEPPDVGGGDLSGAAQQAQAELDAEEDKARTTYVLLILHEAAKLTPDGPMASAWEELGRIRAASRAAAWEEAKRRYPVVKPTEPGQETGCQLVPKRFFQKITARAKPRTEPELEVEGL